MAQSLLHWTKNGSKSKTILDLKQLKAPLCNGEDSLCTAAFKAVELEEKLEKMWG